MSIGLLVSLSFHCPLLLEHFLFHDPLFSVDHCLRSFGVILPREDVQSLAHLVFLLDCLSLFSGELALSVEHPQFGVNLLLDYLLVHLLPFVHQLLFSFQLGQSCHETGFLSSKVVSLHFELSVESLLDDRFLLFLPLNVDLFKSLRHLGSDLLRRFHIVEKLLFEHLILTGQKSCQLLPPSIQIRLVSPLDISYSIISNVFNDHAFRLGLPFSLK